MARKRSGIMSLLRRALVAMVVAQVGVIATLMGIDAWRKRVRPRSNKFPRVEPIDVDVLDSTATIYTFGEDLYADMLAAIRSAQRTVLFESYIVKNDSLGEEFKQALIEAAERGVSVHVVYDGFANLVVPRRFFAFPPSVHVIRYPALRVGLLLFNVRKSGRDHRKILVVDGDVGFVGGYNVGALYATQWRDTHLRVKGAATWELENAFVDLWNRLRAPEQPLLDDPGTSVWEPRIRTQRNVPEQLTYPIRGMYLEAIDRAQHHIYVTQAYFIPDRDILEGLLKAAARGVDVCILVPEVSNHVVADWLSRGFYGTLLRSGVQLWLFQHAMVHAKTATIDGHWSTIGTANIDRLSLTGNYEINLEIIDDGFAAEMERVFENDRSNARRLEPDEWFARPVVAKASELVLAPLRPLL
jgi:cardiolipin synthase